MDKIYKNVAAYIFHVCYIGIFLFRCIELDKTKLIEKKNSSHNLYLRIMIILWPSTLMKSRILNNFLVSLDKEGRDWFIDTKGHGPVHPFLFKECYFVNKWLLIGNYLFTKQHSLNGNGGTGPCPLVSLRLNSLSHELRVFIPNISMPYHWLN